MTTGGAERVGGAERLLRGLEGAFSSELSPVSERAAPTAAPGDISAREPNRPLSLPADNAERLESSGVPAERSEHPGGPPAAPAAGFRPDEIDPATGQPRTGELFNEFRAAGPVDTPQTEDLEARIREQRELAVAPGRFNARERERAGMDAHRLQMELGDLRATGEQEPSRHHYVTNNALPEGLTREQASEVFSGFNAPTREALLGRPNPSDQTDGYVDPSAILPPGRLLPGTEGWGGHVHTNRGESPEGNPWAINTTIPGEHPLNGHITRTLLEHEGRFYIRTEGVGEGNVIFGTERDWINSLVGPRTFNNLDSIAGDYAQRTYLGGQ